MTSKQGEMCLKTKAESTSEFMSLLFWRC